MDAVLGVTNQNIGKDQQRTIKVLMLRSINPNLLSTENICLCTIHIASVVEPYPCSTCHVMFILEECGSGECPTSLIPELLPQISHDC